VTEDARRRPDLHATATPSPTHKKEHWRERDQIIELIAIFKFVKVAGLLAISFGLIHLLDPSTDHKLQNWIFTLSEGASHPHVLQALVMITTFTPRHIQALSVVALFYATLYMIEGIGLWHQSRWAEYLTIVATGLFIPLEIYEITRRFTPLRVGALVVNVAAVLYLIYRLRHEGERVKLI
jgi:uncharacterized membrane protein (DUF2068 family)